MNFARRFNADTVCGLLFCAWLGLGCSSSESLGLEQDHKSSRVSLESLQPLETYRTFIENLQGERLTDEEWEQFGSDASPSVPLQSSFALYVYGIDRRIDRYYHANASMYHPSVQFVDWRQLELPYNKIDPESFLPDQLQEISVLQASSEAPLFQPRNETSVPYHYGWAFGWDKLSFSELYERLSQLKSLDLEFGITIQWDPNRPPDAVAQALGRVAKQYLRDCSSVGRQEQINPRSIHSAILQFQQEAQGPTLSEPISISIEDGIVLHGNPIKAVLWPEPDHLPAMWHVYDFECVNIDWQLKLLSQFVYLHHLPRFEASHARIEVEPGQPSVGLYSRDEALRKEMFLDLSDVEKLHPDMLWNIPERIRPRLFDLMKLAAIYRFTSFQQWGGEFHDLSGGRSFQEMVYDQFKNEVNASAAYKLFQSWLLPFQDSEGASLRLLERYCERLNRTLSNLPRGESRLEVIRALRAAANEFTEYVQFYLYEKPFARRFSATHGTDYAGVSRLIAGLEGLSGPVSRNFRTSDRPDLSEAQRVLQGSNPIVGILGLGQPYDQSKLDAQALLLVSAYFHAPEKIPEDSQKILISKRTAEQIQQTLWALDYHKALQSIKLVDTSSVSAASTLQQLRSSFLAARMFLENAAVERHRQEGAGS